MLFSSQPQGNLPVSGVGFGWGPGSVMVMTPGTGPPGSPLLECPPCVTGSPDLGGDPLEELVEARTMEKIGKKMVPIALGEQGFFVLFCSSGQTLIVLYSVYGKMYSATTVL